MMTKVSTVCDMSYSVWVVGLSLSLGLTLAIVSKRVSKTMMTKISTVCDMSYPIWVVGLSIRLSFTLSIISNGVTKTMVAIISTISKAYTIWIVGLSLSLWLSKGSSSKADNDTQLHLEDASSTRDLLRIPC